MPLQLPVVSIISMSNVVRWFRAFDLQQLAFVGQLVQADFLFFLMSVMAWVSVGRGVI